MGGAVWGVFLGNRLWVDVWTAQRAPLLVVVRCPLPVAPDGALAASPTGCVGRSDTHCCRLLNLSCNCAMDAFKSLTFSAPPSSSSRAFFGAGASGASPGGGPHSQPPLARGACRFGAGWPFFLESGVGNGFAAAGFHPFRDCFGDQASHVEAVASVLEPQLEEAAGSALGPQLVDAAGSALEPQRGASSAGAVGEAGGTGGGLHLFHCLRLTSSAAVGLFLLRLAFLDCP